MGRASRALLGGLLLTVVGCTGDPGPPANLVLISIDALRADHLGVYGHPSVKTPNMDALAAEGIRFERMVVPVPTTLASHTSLMTGTWPHTHGVPSNGHKVSRSNRMLAEILQEAGFRTAGVIGGYPLGPQTWFDQGFDEYTLVEGAESKHHNGPEVSEAALAWLDRREGGRFFLFVHYWDVHWPYSPPPPYDRMYRDDSLEMRGDKADVDATRRALRRGAPEAAERSEVLGRLYAGGVSFVDAQAGLLLEGLRERGLLDTSVVVLTSDHGETMAEHRAEYWNHGNTLYDSVTRVPLIMRLPGAAGAGRVEDWLLSSIDLMPTLLELLGLPEPEGVAGKSFADSLLGHAVWSGRGPVFSQATKPHGDRYEAGSRWKNIDKCRGIWDGAWKLQHCPLQSRLELYDVAADPGEQNDLLASGATAAQQLGRRLAGELADWSGSADPLETIEEESPEVIKELRALGYVE